MNSRIEIPNDLWEQIKRVVPPRNKPLGGGRWTEKEFFEAMATKFSTKRDWDDLEEFGFPPGEILFQQFVEWKSQRVFACLSEMDLHSNGRPWKFKIKLLCSNELPRHIRERAEQLGIDPESLVRPDESAYPKDTFREEIEARIPWLAENRKRVDAMMERHRTSMFATKQSRKSFR